MSGGFRRLLTIVMVMAVAAGASAAAAVASASFRLSVSPARVAPGGTVTISTTPRQACTLTVTIAKKPFTHSMRYGWAKVMIPRRDKAGKVPVKVVCAGRVATGSFMVK